MATETVIDSESGPEGESNRRSGRRSIVLLMGVVALTGLLVLGVWALACSGQGDIGGLPSAKDLARQPLTQVIPVGAVDSGHLPALADTTYGAANLIDNALSTAWVVGAGTDPPGQTATVTLPGPTLVEKLEIANGYQKSGQTFRRSGRATFLLVTSTDGTSSSISLEDRDGWQMADVSDVVTTSLVIKFVEIYPGSDTRLASAAISEVRVIGRTMPPTTTR